MADLLLKIEFDKKKQKLGKELGRELTKLRNFYLI